MTLPDGWAKSPIGDLCDLINGKAFKPTDWAKTGLPIIRIQNLNRSNAEFNYCDVEVDQRFLVEPGELLFAWSGTPGTSFGAHVWNGPRAVLNQHIFRVRHDDRIVQKDYFKQAINSTLAELIGKAHGGVGLAHVTKGNFEATEVLLPPPAEQRRIVTKLDALTARLARARAEMDRVPVLARQFRQVALAECFDAGDGERVALGLRLRAIEAGKNLRCIERPPQPDERGVVKVSAVTWGRFDPKQSKTLPSDYDPPEKARIRLGDLLISRANTLGLVGATVIVEEQPNDLFLSDKILRLVVDEADKRWLMWFLRSPQGRTQIESLATGNQLSMRNISQDALRRMELPFPAADVREARIRSLEAAFARADRLEAEAARARVLIDRLESAILTKAFRGELVPQDPNDEPASVLLDRIRAERAAAPRPKRGRAARASA